MSETIEAKPIAEYPRPGAAETINGVATMFDGILIVETARTGNDELLGWAIFALILSSYTCFRFIGERRNQYQEPQNEMAGNDFWEAPA